MIERQKTETTAEVDYDEEAVLLMMHRKRTVFSPGEARQLAQELLDAADRAEEPPPLPPTFLHPALLGDDFDHPVVA